MLKDIVLQRSMGLTKLSVSIRGVMAIIDIFKTEKKRFSSSVREDYLPEDILMEETSVPLEEEHSPKKSISDFFAFCSVRLLFLLLCFFSSLWFAFAVCKLIVFFTLHLCFFKAVPALKYKLSRAWLSIRRSFICGVSLALSVFSPSLGIMIACTYFLMYDKTGIEEVVPASLREQFKDLFSQAD